MNAFFADIRYAVRGLLARPSFALIAIASLALGIGVNSALFSLFEQVALRPLPVLQPERLVNLAAPGIKSGSTSSGGIGTRDEIFSYPMLRDLQRELPDAFAGLAGHVGMSTSIGVDGVTEVGSAVLATGNYFELLGLAPTLGRLLQPDDDRVAGAGRVVVLSHRYWLDRFGARADVVGTPIKLNGQLLTIVGVAPAGFGGTSFGNEGDLFVPLSSRWLLRDPRARVDEHDRKSYWIYLFGRLSPGATLASAEQAINTPYQRLVRDVELPLHGELDDSRRREFAGKQITLSPGSRGQSASAAGIRQPLLMLLAIGGLVLLIACLNIANLLLARGNARAAEFAIRASIGASRARLVRQLLVEATLLASIGAAVSLPLASLISAGLVQWMPSSALSDIAFAIDARALGFTFATAGFAVLLFGLFPAWQLARIAPMHALRGESGATASRSGNRFRSVLATTQIGFSMAALVLAGLFTKSLVNLSQAELGMQIDRLAVFSIAPQRLGHAPERIRTLYERIEQELAALPGVSAVTTSMVPLLSGSEWGTNVSVEGYETQTDTLAPDYSHVGAGFFGTMGIPLLAGREFTLADNDGAAKVAIINQRFAEYFGLGPNPVGKRMAYGSGELDLEIVGLVGDSKYHDLRADAYPLFFLPWRQHLPGEMSFYLRSELPPEQLLPLLAPLVAAIDPELPVEDARTVRGQIDLTLGTERFVGLLSAAFAVLATLLAALGLYGVVSYTLAQRTREIGLRLALGAAPQRVARWLLWQAGRMSLVGGVLGLLAALMLGRAARSLLFGLDGHDPSVLLSAAGVLLLVAIATASVPARRAARIDPMTALRHE